MTGVEGDDAVRLIKAADSGRCRPAAAGSVPCAFTERGCRRRSAHRCSACRSPRARVGCNASSTRRHSAPPPTRTVPDASSMVIRFIAVMSRISAPGHEARPPMLCRAPDGATFRSCSRAKASAFPSSASSAAAPPHRGAVQAAGVVDVPRRCTSQSGSAKPAGVAASGAAASCRTLQSSAAAPGRSRPRPSRCRRRADQDGEHQDGVPGAEPERTPAQSGRRHGGRCPVLRGSADQRDLRWLSCRNPLPSGRPRSRQARPTKSAIRHGVQLASCSAVG